MRQVDSEKLEIVEEFINSNEDLTSYVKEQGFIIKNNVMSCPFHGSDSTPSLRITGNKWKCFGCGRGGGYIKFLMEMSAMENTETSYYNVVESYVRAHPEVASQVGGSIYKTIRQTQSEKWDEALTTMNEPTYKPKRIKTNSVDILIRRARHKDVDTQMNLLAGLQEGLPYDVLTQIIEGTDISNLSLMDLLSLE